MRWVNGLTKAEKDRIWQEEWEKRQIKYHTWTRWFAWYPVEIGRTTDGKRTIKAWLEYVERVGKFSKKYRTIDENLASQR